MKFVLFVTCILSLLMLSALAGITVKIVSSVAESENLGTGNKVFLVLLAGASMGSFYAAVSLLIDSRKQNHAQ